MTILSKYIKHMLILVVLATGTMAYADVFEAPTHRILILEDKSSPLSMAFASHLSQQIHSRSNQYDAIRMDIEQPDISLAYSLIIAVGESPLSYLLKKQYKGAALSVMVSPMFFHQQMLKHRSLEKYHSAIFHHPPIIRQLMLFKELKPTGRRVGLLLDGTEPFDVDTIRKVAFKLDLVIETEIVSSERQLSIALLRLINRTDAIIGTNNSSIYNPKTIKSILLTLYRHNKFLLGPNKSYIKAGSIATTYTSLQQMLDEVFDEITYHFEKSESKLHAPRSSKRFSVAINDQVARSLNVVINSIQHYEEAVQNKEISIGQSEYHE